MKTAQFISRRGFLKAGALGSTVLAAAGLPDIASASVTKKAGDPFLGLKLGMASYSLRKFTLDEAIAMTRQAGVHYISLKDVHLSLKSSAEERRAAHRKIEDAGLTLMGGGVIYMKNSEPEIRAAFDYARDAGMPTIVCAPDPDALDTVERMARDYQIRIAIHNHGPDKNEYPSPRDVLRLVAHRDALMGICMDVGHTVRIGEDPVEVIRDCAGRLYDFHIKDVTAPTPQGAPIEVGRGVIDIVAVLKALHRLRFAYHVGLEYEANPDAPMPGILESYGYIRGVLAAIG
jgi:sugar phosphate isomerase/epimerase